MVKFMESSAELKSVLAEAGGKLVVIDFTASWVRSSFLAFALSYQTFIMYIVRSLPHDCAHL